MTFGSAFDAKSDSDEFSGYMSYLYAKKKKRLKKGDPATVDKVYTLLSCLSFVQFMLMTLMTLRYLLLHVMVYIFTDTDKCM